MNLEYETAFDLIRKAVKERERTKAWQIWLTKLPYMKKDNFITFEDYYKKITTKPSNTPKEDIINMVNEIRKKAEK